ncbi:MAG: M56 family metallopeptidase [Planctomycetota bacterium]|jgi:beta-lactamase regulating signal transducer with metallopeptidase domain
MMLETVRESPLLFDVLWQTTFWLALGLLGSLVLAQRPARAHCALVMGLVAAVLTPLLSVVFRDSGLGLFGPLTAAVTVRAQAPPELPAASAAPVAGPATWLVVACSLWAAASAALLIRLAAAYVRARRLLADARPLAREDAAALARTTAERLGLDRPPALSQSDRIGCPVVWCWGRQPRIILPATLSSTDPDLTAVLCHELAHWKRCDHWWSLLGEIGMCVLPWHPLLWRVRRRLSRLSEHACDAWVLAAGESRTAFAETLLRLVPSPPTPVALAALSSRRGLHERIDRILHAPRLDPRSGRRWAFAAASATCLVITVAALAHRRAADLEGSNAPANVDASDIAVSFDVEDQGASTLPVRAVPAELDLGRADVKAAKSGTVWLVNTGSEPVRLVTYKASCGCTTVAGFTPGALAPGASMQLEVTMKGPDKPGKKTKKVTVTIEGQPLLQIPVHMEAVEAAGAP